MSQVHKGKQPCLRIKEAAKQEIKNDNNKTISLGLQPNTQILNGFCWFGRCRTQKNEQIYGCNCPWGLEMLLRI